eukprot:396506-Prorocentrum_minimum.AAC.1
MSTTSRRSSHNCQLRVDGPHIMSATSQRSLHNVSYDSGVNFEFDWEACSPPAFFDSTPTLIDSPPSSLNSPSTLIESPPSSLNSPSTLIDSHALRRQTRGRDPDGGDRFHVRRLVPPQRPARVPQGGGGVNHRGARARIDQEWRVPAAQRSRRPGGAGRGITVSITISMLTWVNTE